MGTIITPAISSLEQRAYIAIKRTGIPCRDHAIVDASTCGLDFVDCCWPIPQFVDLNDTGDQFKNDFFTFILEADPAHTTEGTITNLTTGEEQPISDNTFGELYSFGDFPLRPYVLGMKIDWYKVVQEMGYGTYRVLEEVYDGETLVRTALDLCFEVMPFSCEAAHDTVRFETTQTGYIHNGFDYRDIFTRGGTGRNIQGWVQQLRWYGRMWQDVPDEESDFIQMSSRIETQIQQKITDKYKIELYRVKSDFGKHLTNDNFLATKILVSDYNLNNYEVYRNKNLRKSSTDEVVVNKLNSGVRLTFTFKEIDEGTVKRIYG